MRPALKFDLRKLKKAIRVCRSLREVAEYFNNVRSHQYFSKIIKDNKLSISHFKNTDYSGYIGKTFNSLTIKEIFRTEDKYKRIMCRCTCICGTTGKITRLDNVLSHRVISCGCASRNRKSMRGSGNPAFKGIGELGSSYFRDVIQAGAKRRNIPFNVTIDYLWGLFLKQDKKCAFTGMPLWFGRLRRTHETNASLDRIDSTKGYTENNVHWVLKDINKMKWEFSSEHFIKLCSLVTKYQNKQKRLNRNARTVKI